MTRVIDSASSSVTGHGSVNAYLNHWLEKGKGEQRAQLSTICRNPSYAIIRLDSLDFAPCLAFILAPFALGR
jgi:hypothetical protein